MKTKGFVNAFWLKIIMAVLMLLDHLYYYNVFSQRLLPAHYLARLVAPVFTFLMAQGMVHTKNRLRYIGRIFGAAVVMLAGNGIIFALTGQWIQLNILFSLSIGAGLIFCIDKVRDGENSILWLILSAGLIYASFYCEGQHVVPIMTIIFYYFRSNKLLMCAVYMLTTAALYFVPYLQGENLSPQFFMIFAVLPIIAYNDKRGINNFFGRYFFYAFYPLHIWVIFWIAKR